MDIHQHYEEASKKTADNLSSVAHSSEIRTLSRLTLPEIDAVVEPIARLMPAGNIPALILSGLLRLPRRQTPPISTVRRDTNLLHQGVERTLDATVYATFFAGPAAAIWVYQSLLIAQGHRDMATRLAQHYLDAYADGMNRYIGELLGITETRRPPG